MAAHQFLHLPGEILTEILRKVPCIKSLVRCTSVCKSWYSLIKDPHFIAKQLSDQNNTNRYLLCCFFGDGLKERYSYSIRYDNTEFLEYYKLDFRPSPEKGIRIHGCWNGLICFSDSNSVLHNSYKSIYIWNPAIRKFRILPKSIRNPPIEVLGFGFHPKINDYKLVKIGYANKITYAPRVEVEVYSLSTNSWKLITNRGPASRFVRPERLTIVNGTVYWKAFRENWTIVSFDLINETFREILLPPDVSVNLRSLCVGTLGGYSIVIIDGWFNLWAYDQCDESWKKVLGIFFGGIGGILVGFRNNGEALICKVCFYDDCLEMFTYNLDTREGKDFGDSLIVKPYKVEPFVESLVLLNDGESLTR